MSDLSIEQAALAAARRKDSDDWQRHAEREAAAFLAGHLSLPVTYPVLIQLLGAIWLQGVNYGAHETLNGAEIAYDQMRAAL